ncbi:MAG: family 20 glycosylhydrolase [Pseudoxanthomonas sp.]
MNRMRPFAPLIICLSLLAGPAPATDTPIAPSLIPLPASMRIGNGVFIVDAGTALDAQGEIERRVAERFNGFLTLAKKASLPQSPDGRIRLKIIRTVAPAPESYSLDIDANGIDIQASDEAGLLYGAVTLWQLLTQADGEQATLPELHITDAPRFHWRGYMLDSARHFQSVDQVKKILDTMALHKLNVFHWHLTDDQGWRIEIRKHPKLSEVGGCRVPVGDAGIDAATGQAKPYCGFYTQDDIRDVVAYAAARHITVVPEIDLPGHATAAIAAYPQLGTEGKAIPVSPDRGIHSNLFNVDDATFAFLDDVFAEVAQLFPGQYVHVGGDEAIKDQWEASPQVQEKMRALGLKDVAALQSWFIHRLGTLLHAHGKRLLGWDEILEGGLAPDATVMSWRGIEGGIEAAKQGHDVVMSPTTDLYLDYLQTDSPNEPGGRPRPRLIPMRKFYWFEPVPDALNAAQRKHVLGLQANMWTTDDVRFSAVEHNSFPRLLAVAETGWTPKDRKNYPDFLQRLPAWNVRYEKLGVNSARTPFEVLLDIGPGKSLHEANIGLRNPLGYAVHYTLDGSEPTKDSPRHEAPTVKDVERQPLALHLPLPVTVKAAAFGNGMPLQRADEFRLTAASLLTRSDEQLQPCTASGPVLRMQDDTTRDGERALFNVAIMQPCWQWPDAPLRGIAAVEVRVGRLPYAINQSAKEDAARKFLPARSAHGELDVRAGSCDGDTVAGAPLPARPDADGFITLRAPLSRAIDGQQSLCIRFSGDFRPQMWVLDRITLVP